jgi:hypothetical protein
MTSLPTEVQQLSARLRVIGTDSPVLAEVQQRRKAIYVADEAMKADDDPAMPEDVGAMHFVLDEPPSGAIWWRVADRPETAWGGGWFITDRSRLLDGPLLILIVMAQTRRAGLRYGWSTVTHRNAANRLLRHLGARLVYHWHDPEYLCPMDWVEFDLQAVPERYDGLVAMTADVLRDVERN